MNKLRPESIPEAVIAGASALVLTSYLVRCKPGEPMPDATMKAIEYAKKHDVPVVLTLGTKYVIADNPAWWQEFLAGACLYSGNERRGRGSADRLCRSAVSGE
ncbi:inosine-guanosine kinase [Klebsiella pneumoniae]|uniref:Inosine-guanosine kinase n=1 Tax=Klebsiella pneumoniae TaxID=573 RepID=A0A377WEF5_KLEPN|nr:inosine-guanosine kinase [Klebsiella pneumoniae]